MRQIAKGFYLESGPRREWKIDACVEYRPIEANETYNLLVDAKYYTPKSKASEKAQGINLPGGDDVTKQLLYQLVLKEKFPKLLNSFIIPKSKSIENIKRFSLTPEVQGLGCILCIKLDLVDSFLSYSFLLGRRGALRAEFDKELALALDEST